MAEQLALHVISHTHWDREWYQPFEGYRKRLVMMVDHLIDLLEQDPAYTYFHFDGQTIVLDDYLEIRPENRERLQRLIRSGRLIIGPWYVMPDEFLISGESLVRNLQAGRNASRAYGADPMPVGYVVDIFGHNSQFPQILRGFGYESAVLFRGAGDYPRDTFRWQASDGSEVLCLRLDPDRCYSNFYFAVRWPFDGRHYEKDELLQRFDDLLAYMQPRAVSRQRLLLDGVDHIECEPSLPGILDWIRQACPDSTVIHGRLEDYCRAQQEAVAGADLDTIRGELYQTGGHGVNNAVLKNVLSSLVELKQQNDACEIGLTRWAEAFHAAFGPWQALPMEGFLNHAWRLLMQNHPHDSICGCSITAVHQDNLYRFRQVRDIEAEVSRHVLTALTDRIRLERDDAEQALLVFNPAQSVLDGVVEAEVELPADFPDHFALIDQTGREIAYQVVSSGTGSRGSHTFGYLPEFGHRKIMRLALEMHVPAMGYATCWLQARPVRHPGAGEYAAPHQPRIRYPGQMHQGGLVWEHDRLRLIAGTDGGLDVLHKPTGRLYQGLFAFEDSGDCGEGYNYRKPANDQVIYSQGATCEWSVCHDGPLSCQLQRLTHLSIPAGLTPGYRSRSDERTVLTIKTLFTLHQGSDLIDCRIIVDNPAVGHRLRVLFPTRMETDTWMAATPYALQERLIELPVVPGAQEIETGVMPAQGTIMLRDDTATLAIHSRGLYEASVTATPDHTVALTLFRSFPNEIGRDASDLGRQLGTMSFDLAVRFAGVNIQPASLLQAGETWRAGLRSLTRSSRPVIKAEPITDPASQLPSVAAIRGQQTRDLPATLSFLRVESSRSVLTACKAAAQPGQADDTAVASDADRTNMQTGCLEQIIRLFNASGETDTAVLHFAASLDRAWICDLTDTAVRSIEHDSHSLAVALPPYAIRTVRVCLHAGSQTAT